MLPTMRRAAALESIREFDVFRTVQWHDALDSTNRYAAREHKSGRLPLPALVVSDRQSQGVGRGGNAWWSPDGCLMFSIVLPRSDIEREAGQLPLLIGVSVAHAVASMTRLPVRVKWPNDVYLDDRKLCGILIESSAQYEPERSDAYIIGIGINAAVDFRQAPEALRATAISLHEGVAEGLRESATPESLLVVVLQQWIANRQAWTEDADWLAKHWPPCDWLAGKCVEVTQPGQSLQGIARGIDDDGGLLVEDRFGRTIIVRSGTVRSLV